MSEQTAPGSTASIVRHLAPDWRTFARDWAEELDLTNVLTVQEQEILWLRFFMQLDQREVAAALDRSQQLISKVYRKALAKAAPTMAQMLQPSARTSLRAAKNGTPPRAAKVSA
jgi:predicted DNA-binding protein (UPF0251 family)